MLVLQNLLLSALLITAAGQAGPANGENTAALSKAQLLAIARHLQGNDRLLRQESDHESYGGNKPHAPKRIKEKKEDVAENVHHHSSPKGETSKGDKPFKLPKADAFKLDDWRDLDLDKDGKVGKREWLNQASAVFTAYDKDQSGYLEPKEADKLLSQGKSENRKPKDPHASDDPSTPMTGKPASVPKDAQYNDPSSAPGTNNADDQDPSQNPGSNNANEQEGNDGTEQAEREENPGGDNSDSIPKGNPPESEGGNARENTDPNVQDANTPPDDNAHAGQNSADADTDKEKKNTDDNRPGDGPDQGDSEPGGLMSRSVGGDGSFSKVIAPIVRNAEKLQQQKGIAQSSSSSLFKEADRNGSGFLEADEIQALLKQGGAKGFDWHLLDTDKDNRISISEFMQNMPR